MIPDEIKDIKTFSDTELLTCREATLSYSISNVSVFGDWVEFGVYKGETAKFILNLLPDNVMLHLFDSFQGLPEDWNFNDAHKKGRFKCSVPKFDDKRIKMHVGLFKDTIPCFIKELKNPLSFIHVDSDLYLSAKTILYGLKDYIVKGTVIQFDEYFGYSTYREHEYKAFFEFVNDFNIKFKYLARSNRYQLGIKIL